jgi:hypothetical protein
MYLDRHLRGFVSTMGVRGNLALTIPDQPAHWGLRARPRGRRRGPPR